MGLGSLVPVEYFGNKNFEFLPDNKTVQRFEVCAFISLLRAKRVYEAVCP